MILRAVINGVECITDVEPTALLIDLLRDGFGLDGADRGCETTTCGACTVLLDGRAVKSCAVLAVQIDGREITTVEGLATATGPSAIEEGFDHEHRLQCGYCTPGMKMTAAALLAANPDPTEDEIRTAISGNLCRCTGYANVIRAIQYAAARTTA